MQNNRQYFYILVLAKNNAQNNRFPIQPIRRIGEKRLASHRRKTAFQMKKKVLVISVKKTACMQIVILHPCCGEKQSAEQPFSDTAHQENWGKRIVLYKRKRISNTVKER
jgi:hypothetical protein